MDEIETITISTNTENTDNITNADNTTNIINKRNLLVIINPKSGTGKSLQYYYDNKHIILQSYNITLFISRFHEHVYDYFKNNNKEISKINNILTFGGDGILHQVINCLIKYNLDIPVSQYPSGSGNGFFKSICYENNKIDTKYESLLMLEKNKIELMDLMLINKKLYSYLAISWGFISDLDINTEWMRNIGSIRFDIGAVWNIIRKRSYRGTLTYYTTLDNTETQISISDNFIYFWACNTSHASSTTFSSPKSKKDDGWIYISYILNNISRYELMKIILSLSSGKFINNPNVHYIKTKKFKLETKSGIITIDGERANLNTIDVSIIPKKIKVLV